MTKKIAPALCAGLLAGLACGVAQAQDEAFWYGGSLALTSDYVFRGVTQTDEGPALQGSLDFGLANGLYAGVWASNVDFDAPDGIDLEVDVYFGWTLEFANDTWLDLQAVRYLYPGAKPGFGINYNEFIAAYGFMNYTATVAYTNDYLKSDESALYYNLAAEFP
ncbi:MAG: TorF family putative porin, partial [Gammaproteobacteria bacterium]